MLDETRAVIKEGPPKMIQAQKPALQLNPNDTVAIALTDIAANTMLADFGVTTPAVIPRGHKNCVA